MTPMPFSIRQKYARVLAIFAVCLFVAFGVALYRMGESFAGLVLLGWGAILVLGVVYSLDWFQNLDQSLRIFQIIVIVSVFGGVAGLFLYGMEGGVLGCTYTLLFAELGGAVSAIFLRRRDEREEREYEAEMRKYGKEP